MAQADPAIKFAALELSDFGNMASGYMPAFVAGVKAPVDVLATHFYSSCNQKDLDISLFSTVPQFASEVRYIYSQLATNPALATVPVWVTENNVDADYNIGNGTSSCNPGLPYNPDPRGTSAFFAAWRTLVFTQLGEAGAQALYHWSFGTDPQFGEVDATGKPYLSYWVDYYLSHWLPSPPGQDILQTTQSGCCLWINNNIILGLDTTTEALRNPDGSVVVLMSNHAVQTPRKDNNAAGATRTFALDLSALGNFNTATLVTLNSSTPATGPVPTAMTPAAQMQVTLPGYGAALLRLSNTQPALTAGNVANAASYVSGQVAPGEIVGLFGTALGPPSPAFLSLTNPRLVANSLAGVRVLFDGLPAPVLYASASQVNAVVPFSVAGHTSTQLQVEYLGATTASITLPVSATAPGIFTLDASGKGQGAILNAKDESVNSPANPATVGDYVVLFATGAGSTNPGSVDGWVSAPPLPVPIASVTVKIGGIPCHTNFVGAAPGFVAGLLQINAQVPEGITPGPAVPVEVSIGG